MNDAARRRIARVKEIRGTAVVALGTRHRADDSEFVHHLRRARPVCGDIDPWSAGAYRPCRTLIRTAWLGVKRFELARTAGHPEQNAGTILFLQLSRVRT